MGVGGLLNNIQGVGNSTQSAVDSLGRLQTGSFFAQLKPASYRGVPFGVLAGSVKFGRRNVIHQYPFRDTPWVEDMGREARRFALTGFLVGDDVIARRAALLAKVEGKADPAGEELIHPTMGTYQVALIDFTCTEKWNEGRYFELTFTFVEQGKREFPTRAAAGQGSVVAAGNRSQAAAAQAFAVKARDALAEGAVAVNAAVKQAGAWAKVSLQTSRDVTSLVNLGASLPGEFGRLLGQASTLKTGQVVAPVFGLDAQTLQGKAAVSRAKVDSAATRVKSAAAGAGSGSATEFPGAAQGLTEAVRVNSATPGDAIRALGALAAYSPAISEEGPAAVVGAETEVLMRRAATVSMTLAAAAFRPASADDAVAVRDLVLGAVDSVLTEAGDRGDDDVFLQFRSLRESVASDLNARGANLPNLRTFKSAVGLPALVLAHRLYGDIGRTEDLVRRARPVHPAFMPRTFQAPST